jgi:signal transduction histidine kinase
MIIRLSRGYVLLEFERLTNIRLIKERLQREQFIAGIAHDIRSPLTVILSSAQLLQKGITGKSIDRIIENTKRSERMIQNILESSKYTLDHFCIKNEEICDLKKICIDVTENFNNVRRISYDFPEDQVLGKWDKEGVHRIFENLISNAIKYGDEESPILIKINNDRKSVSFSITNFGKPLTKKVQHNLFKSFWRGSEAIKDGKNGWGLGLFVVKGLVEAFKGKIKVESSADKGTKFQVTLPNMLRS